MKKIILIACIFLCGFLQAQKMPSDYFDEGLQYVNSKDYDKAIVAFKYITDNHPHNELYPEAFYNLGYVYYKNKQYDSAMMIFRKILVSNFNEKQEIGGDIMSDPYANYKHRASSLMSEIYYEQNQFDSSLYYFSLSDTAYPYIHFCGNELAENEIYTALKYADIYRKLNKPVEAIKVLLPQVFDNGLANNSEVLDTLKVLLIQEKIKEPKQQLDHAIKKMYARNFSASKGKSYSRYYIKFLDAEIPVQSEYDESDKFDKSKTEEKIRESAFYKMISGL